MCYVCGILEEAVRWPAVTPLLYSFETGLLNESSTRLVDSKLQ